MLPFTDLPPVEPQRPARLAEMHTLYGVASGALCGDCGHLRRYRQGTAWLKCDLTRQTSGSATDWRAGWTACGRFESRRDAK
jgi:hypothetical protein